MSTNTVFVLTDNPSNYDNELTRDDITAVFVKDTTTLIDKLKNVTMAGLVLELPKVMKASRRDRDRLFNYSTTFPVLRTKTDPKTNSIIYLDKVDCFFQNLEAARGKRCRSHDRIQVKLDCAYSVEDDPMMANSSQGHILDISPGGCFVSARTVMKNESFLHLRISALSNSRPILCSVRWANKDEDKGTVAGMGMMFIDLSDGQIDEIAALQLTAQVR